MKRYYEYTSDGARIIDPLYLITNDAHDGLLTKKEIKKQDQLESWYSAKIRLEEYMEDHIYHYNEDGGPIDISLIINDEDKYSNKAMRFAIKIASIVLSCIDNARIHYLDEDFTELSI